MTTQQRPRGARHRRARAGSAPRSRARSPPRATASPCTTAPTRAARSAVAASLPGDGHVVVGADLADPEAVRAMVDDAAAALGGLDVLVNNAGIFAPHPITETTYEDWQRGWQRHARRQPRRRRERDLVRRAAHARAPAAARSSTSPRAAPSAASPAHPAYGASKAGLIAFGQSLARALGPHGISVTAVAPGFTETDMAAEDARRRARRRAPRREPVRPRRDPRGGRRGGALPRLARGRVRERHRARRQRRVVPADVAPAITPPPLDRGVRGRQGPHRPGDGGGRLAVRRVARAALDGGGEPSSCRCRASSSTPRPGASSSSATPAPARATPRVGPLVAAEERHDDERHAVAQRARASSRSRRG